LTTANTVRGQYTSPIDDYQQTDAEVWADDVDVAERGEIATDLEFFCAPSHSQCRRLMKVAAHRANPEWVGTLTCNLRALPVMGERFINVVISELEISGTFEVLSTQLLIDEGAVLTGIEVQVQSMSAAAYDWTTAEEGTPAITAHTIPVIEPERGLPMPVGFDAIANGPYAVLSWDAYDEDYLTGDIRYKQTAEAQWSAWPVAEGARAARVGPLLYGYQYEFQARTRSDTTGRVSEWTASDYITIGTEDWVLVMDGLAASVDLAFADDLYFQRDVGTTLAALVTVNRASIAYAETLDGQWVSFGANVARRTDRGLLVEEVRSNAVRNNSMQGAVAGTPGTAPTHWSMQPTAGITRTIIGVGTTDGIEYIDIRVAGTAAGYGNFIWAPETAFNTIPAAAGQSWAWSWFEALIGGSFAQVNTSLSRVVEFNAGGGVEQSNTVSTPYPTASLARIDKTTVLSGGATAFVVPQRYYEWTGGGAIDFTLRIGWPQLERGAWATSPIRTSGTSATRAADVVTLTAPPSVGAEYTLYAAGTPQAASAVEILLALSDGTYSNVFEIYRDSGVGAIWIDAPGGSTSVLGGAMAAKTLGRVAGGQRVSNQGLAVNGASTVPGAGPHAPVGLNAVRIGSSPDNTEHFGGYIERVAVWPSNRISNAGLQALTAP
jgi:hypothetical protein